MATSSYHKQIETRRTLQSHLYAKHIHDDSQKKTHRRSIEEEREMMRKICELIEAKRQMKHLLARLQNAELCRNTKTTPIYNILIDSYCEMLLLILFVVAEGLFRE